MAEENFEQGSVTAHYGISIQYPPVEGAITTLPVTPTNFVSPGLRSHAPINLELVPATFNGYDVELIRPFYYGDVLSVSDALIQSISRGDIVEFHRALCRLDFDPTKVTSYRRWGHNTLLHIAALSQSTVDELNRKDDLFALLVARYLCNKLGVYVGIRNRQGATAFMKAADENRVVLMSFLVSLGANPNAQDVLGRTATMRGIIRGHADIVKIMEGFGADVNIANNDGVTPFAMALTDGNAQAATDLSGRETAMIPKFESPSSQTAQGTVTAVWDIASHFLDVGSDVVVGVGLYNQGLFSEAGLVAAFVGLPTLIMMLLPSQTVFERIMTLLQLRMQLETLRSLSTSRFTVRWAVIRFLTTIFEDIPQLTFQLYLFVLLPEGDLTFVIISFFLSLFNASTLIHEAYYKQDMKRVNKSALGYVAQLESCMTLIARSTMWVYILLFSQWVRIDAGYGSSASAVILGGSIIVVLLHRYHLAAVHHCVTLVPDLVGSLVSNAAFTANTGAYSAVLFHSALEVIVFVFVVPLFTFDDTLFSNFTFSQPAQILQVVGLSALVIGSICGLIIRPVLSSPALRREDESEKRWLFTVQGSAARFALGFLPFLSIPTFLIAVPRGLLAQLWSLCSPKNQDTDPILEKKVSNPKKLVELDDTLDLKVEANSESNDMKRLSINTDSSIAEHGEVQDANESHTCVYYGSGLAILTAIGLAIAAGVLHLLNDGNALYFGIGSAVVYAAYLVHAVFFSSMAKYMQGMQELDRAFDMYIKSYQTIPTFQWHAEASHTETKTYTDSKGQSQTRTETVVTNRATKIWTPDTYWNQDGPFPRPKGDTGLIRVSFQAIPSFADSESGLWYELEQTKFMVENDTDSNFTFSCFSTLGPLKNGLFYTDKTPLMMRYTYYVYSCILMMAPFFARWVHNNSEYQQMTVNKVLYYRAKPEERAALLPYIGRSARSPTRL